MITYNIAKEYTTTPGLRFKWQGEYSGEEFRDDILIPLIKEHKNIVLELDGVEGYCIGWLEEVFGGLVRHFNSDINHPITLHSKSYKRLEDINDLIYDALSNLETVEL